MNTWKSRTTLAVFLTLLPLSSTAAATEAGVLESAFRSPPHSAGTWVYWWWPSGYVSEEGIVRELNEMKGKGISGALIFHAVSGPTPGHTPFMSDAWRGYFRFAVEEAAKRNITITLNVCEGWNAGGPWIDQDHASARLQHAAIRLQGPKLVDTALPSLPTALHPGGLFVFAWEETDGVCDSKSFLDLSSGVEGSGRLRWDAPAGSWVVVRFGTYVSPQGYVKFNNHPDWNKERYFEANEMDADAMRIHFDHTAKVLIEDVRALAGLDKTFTHLHIDSGETGHPDWSRNFVEDFTRLRGYDPRPFLAARAGLTVDGAEVTARFLEDYARTQGDLVAENYYGGLARLAARHGLGTHSEAAGYQKPTADALRAMGVNDIAMSEFWSRNGAGYIHQVAQAQLRYHDGIKNAAAAAHTFGRKIVQAESFTYMGRMDFTTPLHDLKDIGDRAFCQGLNRNVLCYFMHQAECEASMPGYTWPYVGMPFTVNETWWDLSGAWFDYLNRCQYLLQAGKPVGDFCYYQGEWIPSYIPAKWAMDPSLPQGFDCDAVSTRILIEEARIGASGRLVLPGGARYRYLVLNQAGAWAKPPRELSGMHAWDQPMVTEWPRVASGKPLALSPATLERLHALVQQGLTLVGPPPTRAIGLSGYPGSDHAVQTMAKEVWGFDHGAKGWRSVGKGRVIWGHPLAEIAEKDSLRRQMSYVEDAATAALPLPVETESKMPDPNGFDWIHRRSDGADIYFVANLRNAEAGGRFTFRVGANLQPELWDPTTGIVRDLYESESRGNQITVPLKFAPHGSYFIVFRRPRVGGSASPNFPQASVAAELTGNWSVDFEPSRRGPGQVTFSALRDWRDHSDEGIRHYSGIATYRKDFSLSPEAIQGRTRFLLDLGRVEVIARVRLNGDNCGTAWTAPWQVDITDALRPGENALVVEVGNLWKNRLLADAALPAEERITKTNSPPRPGEKPVPSGLLGPVRILTRP